MIDKIKLIAMYLPQYHEIPENNEFWGKGFTDWTTVRSAKRYFKDIKQPKIPLNENYYDLSKAENIKWQVDLAKKYGIDGFCFYHYWFSSNKQLLQTPSELFLKDKSLDMKFCFCWDNEPWKRTWDAQEGNAWSPVMDKKLAKTGKKTLVEFDYENEDGWKKHFDYLLPFFQDERYIKIDNKPVFMYCNYYKKEELKNMSEFWNSYAKQFGFDGICFIAHYHDVIKNDISDYTYFYQPHFAAWERCALPLRIIDRLKVRNKNRKKPIVYDYKRTWKRIIYQAEKFKDKQYLYGAFVNYDDSPRRGEKGKCIKGKSEKIFSEYMQKLIDISKKYDKEYIFFTAWNEWGEGAYLEPDVEDKFKYLELISNLQK